MLMLGQLPCYCIASERVGAPAPLLLGAGQGRQLEGNNSRQAGPDWVDGWTSRKGRKKDMHGSWHGVRSGACSDQRVDTMMARNEKPALGTWPHHAFMLDLRRGLHARTYVLALARPGQAFGYLTHFGSMWIPSSLFIMFCRGVRSMEPFVSVVSVRRRLLFRWRMCWRLHARAPLQTGTAHASCVESARGAS